MNVYEAMHSVLDATASYGGANSARDVVRELLAAYDALAPDWSNAPEWAQWCTKFENGSVVWFENEPILAQDHTAWEDDAGGDLQRGVTDKLLPIGIDWRLCKWQRPEVKS